VASQSKNWPWPVRIAGVGRDQPCSDSRLGCFAKRSERNLDRSRTNRKAPPQRGFSLVTMKSLAALSRRRLHICVRLSLKFLPALIRTEKIFPSRKLRVEFTSVLVNFHSANWILRHRSPPFRDLLSSSPVSLQNSFLSPPSSKSLTPFAFLWMHLFYLQSQRKILHSPCSLYLIPAAHRRRNHDILLAVHTFEPSCSAPDHLAGSCFCSLCI
jgi:hypothetical protein